MLFPAASLIMNVAFYATLALAAVVGTTISIALYIANAALMLWDYIERHVFKVRPATKQFPMNSPNRQYSYDKKQKLDDVLTSLRYYYTRVTFDHFEEANVITCKLLANSPTIDVKLYGNLALFS